MDEAISTSVQLVLDATPHKRTRQILQELFHIALPALQHLSTLDEKIYQCYSCFHSDHEENGTLDLMITVLRNNIFVAPNQLVQRLESWGFMHTDESESDWNSGEFDLDVLAAESRENHLSARPRSSSEFLQAWVRPSQELPLIKENEIEAAIDSLAPEELDVQERTEQLKQDIGLLGRALRDQLHKEEERLRQAFHEAHYSLMIRELDTSRISIMEGLFALVSTVFSHVLGDFDPKMLPGYRNVLQQTLVARKEVASLMHTTNKNNTIIQDTTQTEELRRHHLHVLQQTLEHFLAGHAFRCLQPANRWELVQVKQSLAQKSLVLAAQGAEGLSKFLESLLMINQSDMLQQHDQQVKDEIFALLEAAHSVVTISITHGQELTKQAQDLLLSLYGHNALLDQSMEAWRENPPSLQNELELQQHIEKIRKLLR